MWKNTKGYSIRMEGWNHVHLHLTELKHQLNVKSSTEKEAKCGGNFRKKFELEFSFAVLISKNTNVVQKLTNQLIGLKITL